MRELIPLICNEETAFSITKSLAEMIVFLLVMWYKGLAMVGKTTVDSIDSVIEEIKQGRPVIVVDDEDRENEGDLIVAAEAVTPEIINFLERFAEA
jgi:hypothetical protein